MRAFKVVVFAGLLSLLACGCQDMTPAQAAKATAAKAAKNAAADTLAEAQARFEAHRQEYHEIKRRVDAGESIPAVLVSRFASLERLIAGDAAAVATAQVLYNEAVKTDEEAAAAGVAWYHRWDWLTTGKVAVLILLGAASTYFPIAVPALKAAKAVISGVSAIAAKDPAAGQAVKDAVLEASRALGVEAKLDAMVQKFDPPAADPQAKA